MHHRVNVKGIMLTQSEYRDFVRYLNTFRVQQFTQQDVQNWLKSRSEYNPLSGHDYREALEGEGWAIGDYKDMISKADKPYEIEKIRHIMKEEQEHQDELLSLMGRSVEHNPYRTTKCSECGYVFGPIYCPKCGTEGKFGAKKCWNCGKIFGPVYCPSCSTEVEKNPAAEEYDESVLTEEEKEVELRRALRERKAREQAEYERYLLEKERGGREANPDKGYLFHIILHTKDRFVNQMAAERFADKISSGTPVRMNGEWLGGNSFAVRLTVPYYDVIDGSSKAARRENKLNAKILAGEWFQNYVINVLYPVDRNMIADWVVYPDDWPSLKRIYIAARTGLGREANPGWRSVILGSGYMATCSVDDRGFTHFYVYHEANRNKPIYNWWAPGVLSGSVRKKAYRELVKHPFYGGPPLSVPVYVWKTAQRSAR